MLASGAQSQPGEREEQNGEAAEDHERLGGRSTAGRPRTAWSNRICIYQRSGSSAPQMRAKPPIASTGKPTPAKPKAGLQNMAVRLRPSREVADQELEQARRARDRR